MVTPILGILGVSVGEFLLIVGAVGFLIAAIGFAVASALLMISCVRKKHHLAQPPVQVQK